jgi:hypothetical protein
MTSVASAADDFAAFVPGPRLTVAPTASGPLNGLTFAVKNLTCPRYCCRAAKQWALPTRSVGVDRIEIVHRAGEMLEAYYRRGAFLAETPVGEAHTADILELGRRGFVEIDVRHGFSCDVDCVSQSRSELLKGQPLWVSDNIWALNASTKPCSFGPTFAGY